MSDSTLETNYPAPGPQSPASAAAFRPPTAEQWRKLLERRPPRGPNRAWIWLPSLTLLVSMAIVIFSSDGSLILLALLAMLGVAAAAGWHFRRMREIERSATRLQELTLLRQSSTAVRFGWRMLRQMPLGPEVHLRVTAMVSHCLDQLKAYEAAIIGYDYLLEHLPSNHPGALQIRIQRVMTQLAADHLSDADASLRALRGLAGLEENPAARASLRLAQLMQQAKTNHYADVASAGPQLVQDLRPMGFDAAYGYALQALAHHHLALAAQRQVQNPDTSDNSALEATSPQPAVFHREEAKRWWWRATLLLSPPVLLDRLAELAPLLPLPAAAMPGIGRKTS